MLFVELMNRLLYFLTQPIDWYDKSEESNESFFLLLPSIFFLEKTALDLLAFC